MTREEYQKHMELVKKAVKDDLTSLDSKKSVLKARVWCRDDEDRFRLCCYYDFSPYMDMLFRRFEPDVKEWIHEKYIELKELHQPSEKRYKTVSSETWRKYHQELYSEEQISKKYYVTVTKYTEIDRNMTILYSADFSLKGELVSIDDPTGYYRGFAGYEEKGYTLSKSEKIISDNLYLFGPYSDVELPYDKGDILYIDGSPHERPFYAVWCGDRFLYIKNGERLADFIKYKIPERYYRSHNLDRVSLEYHKPVPPYYHVEILKSCDYGCLMEASRLLKNLEVTHNDDLRENVRELFREEFQDTPIPAEFKSGSRMNEICHLLLGEICKRYPKTTFTNFFKGFSEWLKRPKKIRPDALDDEQLLCLLSYYCAGNLDYYEYRKRKFADRCITDEPQNESRMREICFLLSEKVSKRYQKTTFTVFFARFKEWLGETKRIYMDKLDDGQLLYLLSYYCSDHLNYHEYRSREFEKWCQDRDNLFWCE